MGGWLYERIAEKLKPYELTPEEYIKEMRAEGASWSEIQTCLIEDTDSWDRPNPATLKAWV